MKYTLDKLLNLSDHSVSSCWVGVEGEDLFIICLCQRLNLSLPFGHAG